MRKYLIVVFITLISVSVSGCMVSKKDYILKSGEANRCSENLKASISENEILKNELSKTQSELSDCNGDLKDTSARKADLERKLDTQEAVNEELKNQNDRLGDLLLKKEVSQSTIIKETMDINKRLQGINGDLREKLVIVEGKAAELDEVTLERDTLRREKDELQIRKAEELGKLKSTYDELVSGLKNEIEAGEIQIRRMKDRLSVNLTEKVLFDSGSAALKITGMDVMRKVGDQLARIEEKRIQIEGHTDNVPIGGRLKEKFPTNWELSASRAQAVVHFLQNEVGIDATRLSGAGYGEYQPVASNDTVTGKAANRRIEIVLLPPYESTSEAQETTSPVQSN